MKITIQHSNQNGREYGYGLYINAIIDPAGIRLTHTNQQRPARSRNPGLLHSQETGL